MNRREAIIAGVAGITAVVFGGAWLAFPPEVNAGAWVNQKRPGRWGVDKRWRWGMGQPSWLWRRRCMGQSSVSDFIGHICVALEINQSLGFLPAALVERQGDRPFVCHAPPARPNRTRRDRGMTKSTRRAARR